MPIDPQFLDWMNATVDIQNVAALSTDGYASKVYLSTMSVNARIENAQRIVKSHDGREVISPITIYMPPFGTAGTSATLVIGPTSRVMLPPGTNPLISSSSAYLPPVLVVNGHQGEDGTLFYWEVALG